MANTITFRNEYISLNPCCNGICSRRVHTHSTARCQVSILVVMEYALGEATSVWRAGQLSIVSILVVMEYALGAREHLF